MQTGAAYIRVSTDDQLEYSPDSQLKIIRDYAKSHDIILPDEYIFQEEDGVSGRKAEKRPAFMRMIGTAKQKPKPFDCILIWKFSRFARNRQDSIVYKTMLRKQLGIDVISVSENVGDDKMSILIEALIEAMDEYYSVNLSEEVKRGMTEKASRGGIVSGPPFGYLVQDGVFVPDPDKAPIVQMVFDEYLSGTTLFELARKLNDMGVKSRRGNPMENRTVEYILRNAVYIGKIHWNPSGKTDRDYYRAKEILVDGSHEAIILLDTWNKVQNKLNEQKRMYPYKARAVARQEFALRGIVRCSSCGSTLVMSARNTGLQCHAYSRGRCKVSHYINLAEITAASLSIIETLLETGNFVLLHKSTQSEDATDRLISREYQKLERVKAAYESGVDSLEEYKTNKAKITAEIARLEALRPKPAPDEAAIKKAFAQKHKGTLKKLRDPNVPEDEKNRLLRNFVDRITFDRASTSLDVVFHD